MRAGLVILAVTVALMLGLMELTTRWVFADIGSTADNTSYFAERWRAAEGGGVNALGMREREIEPKAEGVTRIAFVGDSVTYGQGVRRDERYTERLAAALGPGFEVLNFGVPGANYEQHETTIERAITEANPDVLIVQWLFNDVQPIGERRPRSWRLAGPLHYFVQPYSALYFMANRAFGQLQADLGLAPDDRAYFARFADPDGAPAIGARRRLEDMLDRMAETGLPQGLILWPTPNYDSLIDQVLDVCAARALPCLDLRPAMAEVPADQSLAVSIYDAHPSAIAHQYAAVAIRPWLLDLIGAAPRAGPTTSD